jgi:(p)ppGpp synthase/HD superfamily hydrolase
MIYTPLTKKAMKIAFEAHKEQVDKTGIPYIYHPMHLAEQMDDEFSTCTALLHDVVEDSDMTFEELEAEGFPKEVLSALRLLTHEDGVEYMDYVRNIKNNKIATKVKFADLKHNSDISRLDFVDEYALRRNEKYKKAMEILFES